MKAMVRRILPERAFGEKLARPPARWKRIADPRSRNLSRPRVCFADRKPRIIATSIGVHAFDAVFKHPTGLSVDTDFVHHTTFLNIEGVT